MISLDILNIYLYKEKHKQHELYKVHTIFYLFLFLLPFCGLNKCNSNPKCLCVKKHVLWFKNCGLTYLHTYLSLCNKYAVETILKVQICSSNFTGEHSPQFSPLERSIIFASRRGNRIWRIWLADFFLRKGFRFGNPSTYVRGMEESWTNRGLNSTICAL